MLITPRLPAKVQMSEAPSTSCALMASGLPLDAARRVNVSERFSRDLQGVFVTSRFSDYVVDVSYAAQMGTVTPQAEKLTRDLSHARDDVNNLALMLHRMERTQRESAHGAIEPVLASMYQALDIELFHVVLRSSLDYCACAIVSRSNQKGASPRIV